VDVFSANGNELTSVPYRFTNHFTIDDQGNVLSAYQTGVLIKVPLATGQTFLVAGRADFLTITEDFVSVPTHGVTRNLDAFCAALSG
jgi:hypothetical protein